MTPLVGLTVFAYLFLIALCLTLWAALTLRDGRRSPAGTDLEAGREQGRVAQRLGAPPVWRADDRPKPRGSETGRAGRRGGHEVESVPLRVGLPEVSAPDPVEGTGRVRVVGPTGYEPRREPGRTITARKLVVDASEASQARPPVAEPGATPDRRPSNDDVRGAKVVVKQQTLDDAFDRFIEVDRKDRGF